MYSVNVITFCVLKDVLYLLNKQFLCKIPQNFFLLYYTTLYNGKNFVITNYRLATTILLKESGWDIVNAWPWHALIILYHGCNILTSQIDPLDRRWREITYSPNIILVSLRDDLYTPDIKCIS